MISTGAVGRFMRDEGGPSSETAAFVERFVLAGEEAVSEAVVEAWRPDGELALAPELFAGTLPDGGVAFSDSSAYAIKIAASGNANAVSRMLTRPFLPASVTDRIRDAHREDLLAQADRMERSAERAGLSGLAAIGVNFVRQEAEDTEFYHEFPVVGGLKPAGTARSGSSAKGAAVAVSIISGTNNKPAASRVLAEIVGQCDGLSGKLFIGYPALATHAGRLQIDALWASLAVGGPFPDGVLSPDDSLAWLAARDALLAAQPVVRLGELGLDSTGPEVFGLVADVAMDGDDNLFVLDRRNHQVRVFDPTGEYLFAVGDAGEGPSEFRDPKGIEVLADDLMVVADRGNQLKIFARSDDGYKYVRTASVPLVPEGICSVKGRVFFVSGWEEDNTIIHEVDVHEGEMVQHFGEGYRTRHALIGNQLSDGPIGCFDSPPRVVYAFQYLPIVRSYELMQRTSLWSAWVEDFAQMQITSGMEPNGTPYVQFTGDGPSETIEGAVRVSRSVLLLQSYLEGPREDDPTKPVEQTVRSYLVDVNSGHGAWISDSLPMIKAVGANRYVAVYTDPYPAVEVRVFPKQQEAT